MSESQGGYDVGQACLNGHRVNEHVARSPQYCTKFCGKCGEPTITACPKCNNPIRGGHSGVYGGWIPPSYCHECGTAYPWTIRRAEALTEVIDELEQLQPETRNKLKQSIPDLLRDSPKTEIAVVRFRHAIDAAGPIDGKMLSEFLAKVVTPEVLKHLEFKA